MKPASTPSGEWRVYYLTSEWVNVNFKHDAKHALRFFDAMSGVEWEYVKALRLYRGDTLMIARTKYNFTE